MKRSAAVVISIDDLESFEETLDILNGAARLADIRERPAEHYWRDRAE